MQKSVLNLSDWVPVKKKERERKCSHCRLQTELLVLLVFVAGALWSLGAGGGALCAMMSALTTVAVLWMSALVSLTPRALAVTFRNMALMRSSVLAETK